MANIPPGLNVFDSSQSSLYAATFATFSLASVAVALRFGSRWLTKSGRWYDDWLIASALAVSFLLLVDMCFWVRSGFGRHFELFGPAIFPTFFRYLLVADITYAAIQLEVKMSMLAFYLRVFDQSSLRKPVAYLGVFTCFWFVAAFFTALLQCDPAKDSCDVASRGFPIGIWVCNMLANIAVVVLPLCYISRCGLSPNQRRLQWALFAAGGFVCVAAAIRLFCLLGLNPESLDFTWDLVPFGIWTLVECNVAIVAACLPALGPVSMVVGRRDRGQTVDVPKASAWDSDMAEAEDGEAGRPFRDSDYLESARSSLDEKD